MRDKFVSTLLEIAKKDKNVLLVTGDLGFGVLKPFFEELPEQIINVGIAEQNMTGFAAGLALSGKTVFTYSIGNFPTLRCLEQIRNDCAYHNANVKVVCVGGGFVYGPLGMSHHATEDLAIMRSLPNVTVLAPSDLIETECATKAIYELDGTCYLRLGRGGEGRIHKTVPSFTIGKAIKIQEGSKIAICSTGSIFDELKKTNDILMEMNIIPSLYTFPTVKPIDKETIKTLANTHSLIVTVEEHNEIGGFGSAVSEVVASLGCPCPVLRIGIPDTYANVVGSNSYLREYYGLSGTLMAERILNVFNNK